MDVCLSGMAGAIHYLSEMATPETSCFPAFELWPANSWDWGWWRGKKVQLFWTLSWLFAWALDTDALVIQLSTVDTSKHRVDWTENEDQTGTEQSAIDCFVWWNWKPVQKNKGNIIFGQKYRWKCWWNNRLTEEWRGRRWIFLFLRMNTYKGNVSKCVGLSALRSPVVLLQCVWVKDTGTFFLPPPHPS